MIRLQSFSFQSDVSFFCELSLFSFVFELCLCDFHLLELDTTWPIVRLLT